MKVFISWSGEPSRRVADALRQWIPDVIQSVTPWMSQADIAPGARWSRDVQQELSETRFGVICLTRTNQQIPWVLFEAGALAKSIEETFVCPYLIGVEPSEILPGPLTQFQAKRANENGTWELILGMNRALKENALEESRLRRLFDRSWPDLNTVLESVGEFSESNEPRRSVEDMVAEILETVRGLARQAPLLDEAEASWLWHQAYLDSLLHKPRSSVSSKGIGQAIRNAALHEVFIDSSRSQPDADRDEAASTSAEFRADVDTPN